MLEFNVQVLKDFLESGSHYDLNIVQIGEDICPSIVCPCSMRLTSQCEWALDRLVTGLAVLPGDTRSYTEFIATHPKPAVSYKSLYKPLIGFCNAI